MEQFLSPGNVCCLGTVNLTQFVTSDRQLDFDGIKKYVSYLVRFLDNVDSYSDAPLPEYVDSMRNKRRIGCGVMGWGSALIMLGVKFASKEALEIQEKLITLYARTAYETSIDLAIEKGKFTYCDPIKHSEGLFVNSLNLSDEYMDKLRQFGIRNSSLMSQQPNGNCQSLDTIIQTIEYGNISFENLIHKQFGDINIEKLEKDSVLKLKNPIHIKTFSDIDVVENIYVNGFAPILKFKMSDGSELKQTLNHKYLVKIDENTAKWFPASELKIGMKILAI